MFRGAGRQSEGPCVAALRNVAAPLEDLRWAVARAGSQVLRDEGIAHADLVGLSLDLDIAARRGRGAAARGARARLASILDRGLVPMPKAAALDVAELPDKVARAGAGRAVAPAVLAAAAIAELADEVALAGAGPR